MPGYDLHPGVDAEFQFPPEVRAAIVASPEMVAALNTLYTDARARGNHTGSQLAATISDFAAAVRALTASETANGTSERATPAEVQAMTDTTRYISPAGLAAAAVSAATANRVVRRDAAGRAQIVAPSAAADIANKGYVDGFETWRDNTRPVFQVRDTGNVVKSGTATTTVYDWREVLVNQGNCYDTALDRFVAPVKGLYHFDLSATSAVASTGGPQMGWWKNGVDYRIAIIFYTTSYLTSSSSLNVLLDVGDYIDIRLTNANSSTITVDGTRSQFGGYLLAVVP